MSNEYILVNSIYLETTALIDSVLKGWYPKLTSLIESAERITTSQYSKMEIKKGFLHNWILLYNKAVQYHSIEDVKLFISNLSRSPQKYYLGACIDASRRCSEKYSRSKPSELSEQYGEISNGEIELKMFKSTLRIQIRRCFDKIDKIVNEIYNPMSCFLDLESPIEKKGMFENEHSQCNKSKFQCNIKKYFNDNQTTFDSILEKLINLEKQDEETKRRIRSLRDIIKIIRLNRPFSNLDQNQKLCWNCGDVIHAVLAAGDNTIITCNLRHFEPICAAIGKKVVGYSSPKT